MIYFKISPAFMYNKTHDDSIGTTAQLLIILGALVLAM